MTIHNIFFHDKCMDGFVAAFYAQAALRRRFPDDKVRSYRVNYSDSLDEHADLIRPLEHEVGAPICVYYVDFCPVFFNALAAAFPHVRFTVVDHHKAARDRFTRDEPQCFTEHGPNYEVVFDMSMSGATMAYRFFNETAEDMPLLAQYVEDHDLYRHKLPHTREVTEWLRAQTDSYERFAEIDRLFGDENVPPPVVAEGAALLMYREKLIEHVCESVAMLRGPVHNGFDLVPVVNSSLWQSEVGEALYTTFATAPFVAVWSVTAEGTMRFSLRSAKDGADVDLIARRFGGGGHKHAAGFTVPWTTLEEVAQKWR